MAFIVTASEYIFEIELIKKRIFEGVFCASLSPLCDMPKWILSTATLLRDWQIFLWGFEERKRKRFFRSFFLSLALRGICPSIEIVSSYLQLNLSHWHDLYFFHLVIFPFIWYLRHNFFVLAFLRGLKKQALKFCTEFSQR